MTASLRSSEPTDTALAERATRGDEWALGMLYKRHARYVAGVAWRLLGRDDEVDDVVQETFLIAAESLGTLRDASTVRAWLVRIAARRVSERWAKRGRLHRFLSGLAMTAAPRSEPEAVHAVGALARSLEAVPTELRVPWVLHHIEGMTLPEVASITGASLATVKRRISAARSRLGEVADAF